MSAPEKRSVATSRSWLLAVAIGGVVLSGVSAHAAIQHLLEAQRLGRALSGGDVLAVVIALVMVVMPVVGARLARTSKRVRAGRVEADAVGLTVDGKRVLRREQVRHTQVMQTEQGLVLRFVRRLGVVDVPIETEEEATTMLRAMRLDRTQWVEKHLVEAESRRRGASRLLAAGLPFLGYIAAIAVVGGYAPGLLRSHHVLVKALGFAAYAPFLYVLIEGLLKRQNILEVGADGVLLRHPFRRGEFTPFAEIASATLVDRDVTIQLRNGRTLTMFAPGDVGPALVARIQAAIEAVDVGATAPVIFAHSDASTADWLRSALAASDEIASFRRPAVPPDVLWRIVEDPSAVPTARVGAAVALRHRLDDDGRSRLRIAADACAERPLRGALEAVATECSEAELLPQLERSRQVRR